MHCPEHCLIRLFKLYNSKCPIDRPDSALYLRPLKEGVWYQKAPVGHNWLVNVIPRLFKQTGVSGKFRATTATRLFDAGVDKQLIMSRTGQSSTTGVRSYKHVTAQLCEKTSSILNARDTEQLKAVTPTTTDQKENSRASDSTMWEFLFLELLTLLSISISKHSCTCSHKL